MDTGTFITVFLIGIGAGVMLHAFISTLRIIKLIGGIKYRINWKALLPFMALFFFSYLLTIGLIATGNEAWILTITGAVFFFGALFVAIVVRTGYKTIGEIKNLYSINQEAERKKEEQRQQLKEVNKYLESKNEELEQFAYIASHDLREPLRTVKGIVELLDDKYKGSLDKDGQDYFEYLGVTTERMEKLINALLEYSRIGNEKQVAEVNVNRLINDIERDMGKVILESEALISAGKLPTVKGYETELRQLFQNLVSNAIKFVDKDRKPKINISAQPVNGHGWQFSVSDNGIGIKKDDRDKIFVIFKRLHSRHDYDGTGIGLSHCKKIVELHKGQIWVDDSPEGGSRFNFTIYSQG